MSELSPSLWRTCRVLANELRLKLLWKLFQNGECSMSGLADSLGLKESTASTYLRLLNSRGLIFAERRKNFVFYRLEANPIVSHAEELLEALLDCYKTFMPVKMVMFKMTAFTHSRRIDIVSALKEGDMEVGALSVRTQISLPALYRHLKKLEDRGFVLCHDQSVEICEPGDVLSKTLLKAACS